MITITERLQDDFQAFMKLFNRFASMMHVAAPGIIQTFDAATQTVSVKLAIKDKVALDGDDNNVRTIDDYDLPVLSDLPIVIPRAGGFALTLPIAVGDECLVVFADTCIDAWFQSGAAINPQAQMFKRKHDLSDGFAIIGVGSNPEAIANYSTNKAELRSIEGTQKISLDGTNIRLEADPTSYVNVKSGQIDLVAAAVNITATTLTKTVTTDNTISMDIQHNGLSYQLHTHSGVTTGSGISGAANVP